ncbi:unnamed protein product [Ostreobium quekettii]|uniref:Uncharacterized protein n=1 Tax=Ostreobium quekettii TaxID=121088 RepID=A0A8S1ISP8_9CHLO|nr:unnamed protein product [Ostreobium quekettii]
MCVKPELRACVDARSRLGGVLNGLAWDLQSTLSDLDAFRLSAEQLVMAWAAAVRRLVFWALVLMPGLCAWAHPERRVVIVAQERRLSERVSRNRVQLGDVNVAKSKRDLSSTDCGPGHKCTGIRGHKPRSKNAMQHAQETQPSSGGEDAATGAKFSDWQIDFAAVARRLLPIASSPGSDVSSSPQSTSEDRATEKGAKPKERLNGELQDQQEAGDVSQKQDNTTPVLLDIGNVSIPEVEGMAECKAAVPAAVLRKASINTTPSSATTGQSASAPHDYACLRERVERVERSTVDATWVKEEASSLRDAIGKLEKGQSDLKEEFSEFMSRTSTLMTTLQQQIQRALSDGRQWPAANRVFGSGQGDGTWHGQGLSHTFPAHRSTIANRLEGPTAVGFGPTDKTEPSAHPLAWPVDTRPPDRGSTQTHSKNVPPPAGALVDRELRLPSYMDMRHAELESKCTAPSVGTGSLPTAADGEALGGPNPRSIPDFLSTSAPGYHCQPDAANLETSQPPIGPSHHHAQPNDSRSNGAWGPTKNFPLISSAWQLRNNVADPLTKPNYMLPVHASSPARLWTVGDQKLESSVSLSAHAAAGMKAASTVPGKAGGRGA